MFVLLLTRFLTSHLLNEGSGVTQFVAHYSFLYLPKITILHNPLLYPICVQQVGDKIEASRERALLLVRQTHATRTLLARYSEG